MNKLKKEVILILLILVSSISFAELQPGKLWINDVEIPYSIEEVKPTPTVESKEEKAISYIYANGQRIAKVEANEVYYFHNDHLGSPRVITDSNGNIVEEINYLPFGEELSDSNSKIQYNSKELDFDTKLHYYGARYYNAPTGRFITADIVKGNLIDPQSLNLYVYVKNNPLKFIDPLGQQTQKAVIFLPDLTKHENTELAIRDYQSEIIAAFKLKKIYTKEGYDVNIIPLAQSGKIISRAYETIFGDVPNVKESLEIVEQTLRDEKVALIAFFGHGGRADQSLLPGAAFDLYRKQSEFVIEEIVTLTGSEIIHSKYKGSKFHKSLSELNRIEIGYSSKKCEFYNCALIEQGAIFAPALPWIISKRETVSYDTLFTEINKIVSGQKSSILGTPPIPIGEKDK